MALRGVQVIASFRTIHLGTLTAGKKLDSRNGILIGIAVLETTGAAPAKLLFHDGQDATGAVIVPYTLLANESARDAWAPLGWVYENGLYVEVVSGSIDGSVLVGLGATVEQDDGS